MPSPRLRFSAAATCAVAVLAAALAAFGLGAPPASAQELPSRIVDIRVEGTRRVEAAQVTAVVGSRVNAPLNPDLVSRDLRAIFAMGFFQDARAELEPVAGQGYRLVFIVVERPRLTSLLLAGNSLLDTKALQEGIPLKPGSFYSQPLVERTLEKLRALYREKGYFKVKLTTRLERFSDHDYGLTIQIEEVPRIYVTDIRIRGASVLNEMRIKRMMVTNEVDCFDWINSYGTFDEDKINYDLQLIASEYTQQGYIRVFIDKPKVTLVSNAEFTRIIVELNITEGEQYFTGALDIAGDLLNERSEIMPLIRLETGTPYSPQVMSQDQARLTELYQEQGYAFAQAIPDRRIDDSTRIVDVTYNLRSGEKAYIRRIEFQGNRETRDFVLRREFLVRENELFNGRKLRESNANLRALGYFKPSTAVETQPTEVNNILNTVTKVEESQTGTLQGQIGFSDVSGLTGSLSVSKANLGGRGQTIRAGMEFAQRNVRSNYTFEFTEPRLLETEFSSTSSLGYATRDDVSELNRGLLTELTAAQGFGYRLLPRLQVGFAMDATNRDFHNRDVAPVQLRSFTSSLSYRSVNNPTFPSDGAVISVAATQIGGQVLQGTTEYRRYGFTAQRFFSLNASSTLILMGRMRLGWLEQVGNNVIPVEDRFRIGGISSIHGYSPLEIGGPLGAREARINQVQVPQLDAAGNPVLDATGAPLLVFEDPRLSGLSDEERGRLVGGGTLSRVFNVELLFPLASDNVRGVIVYDAGNVNAERDQYRILREQEPEFFDLLVGYGGGIRLISPLGVLRFEYGIKAVRKKGETGDRFDFTISTLF